MEPSIVASASGAPLAPSLPATVMPPTVVRAIRPLRVALMVNLAPRKLGSFEDWISAFAAEGVRRGHAITVFGFEPIHPALAARLAQSGARWRTLGELTRSPMFGVRRLAREFDVVELHLFGVVERAALLAYAAWPLRVIYVDHVSTMEGHDDHGPTVHRALRWMIARRVSGIAAVSNWIRDRDLAALGERHPVRTIYNGIDVARFAWRPRERYRRELRLISVANLIAPKGVDVLLQALARLADVPLHLDIVGDGPELPALRTLAAQLGVAPRVSFLGLRDDVEHLLADADLFVHPARWNEAFGLVVAEAMASGCPVVAARGGALPELIEDGVNGVLVEPGDPEALARALRTLAGDAALRRRIAECARARVEERFRLEQSVARHLDWCEEVAITARRSRATPPA